MSDISRLNRFYPRPVTVQGFQYYEVYDCVEHRVLGTTSDWFDALDRCHTFQKCSISDPIQLSINFDF